MSLPRIETLLSLLDYNPDTGALTWKYRTVGMFKTARDAAAWNTRFSGRPAFASVNRHGYLQGKIFGRLHAAHRVAWALHYGEWPVGEIDHENGNRTDNRAMNLRDVTREKNMRNQKRPANNTSGAIGVCWHRREAKWRAYIKLDGRSNHLGLFDHFDAAVAARKAAEAAHGFHPHHGRSA